MATAAERLQDALVRHAIDIERLKKGTADKFIRLLLRADADMVSELRRRLDSFGATGPTAARKIKSLNKLIDAVVNGRRSLWIELRKQVDAELSGIARMEATITAEMIEQSIGLDEFETKDSKASEIAAGALAVIWLGRSTRQHLKALEIAERSIIERSIRQGVFEGLAADQITAGLRGSTGFGRTDGALQPVRRNLETLIASAVLAITQDAQERQFADSGVVTGLVWTSVLDGRTTEICISRDGFGVPLTDDFPKDIPLLKPIGARPPAHYNCRSHMEATLRDVGIVKPHRTFVTDSRTNKKRRIDFRAQAKADAGENWSAMTERQRRRRIRTVANQWAAENIGTVAARTTYTEFFARQSAAFQDSVLGPTRGLLYRKGGLQIKQFVDALGRRLTLEQLQEQHPTAFARAGF